MQSGSDQFQPLKLDDFAAESSDATRLFIHQILQVEDCPSILETTLGSSSFHAQTVASMMLPVNSTAQPWHLWLLLLVPGELDLLAPT